MDQTVKEKKALLESSIAMASRILGTLKKESSVNGKIDTMSQIKEIPNLSGDEQIRQMKDYQEMKRIMKELYIETAKTIMGILSSGTGGASNDASSSFNYSEPLEPLLAAECIPMLPNAYIGGPIKTAINCSYKKVKKFAVEYYEGLPRDLKLSEVFPPNFSRTVKAVKEQLEK